MKKHLPVIALLALSLTVHFAWFGHPNTTVFDEVHFGKFISAYFTHEYYFDIHPPLGKLILAGWGKLWGFRPGFSFANIGDAFPDRTYLALRFLPALAGALLPLVIYGLARQLNMSRTAGLLAGVLVALDNALLVQSRLILLDPFLLLFGFSAVYCYLRWRSSQLHPPASHLSPIAFLLSAGLLGGMAMSVKWTGLTFLGLIGILETYRLVRSRPAMRHWLLAIGSLVAIPGAIYYLSFAVHFALLSKPGPGDAFMSQAFQHGTLSQPEKFIELNAQMYESNQRLAATHPYSSQWYTWPLMQRPIFYWVKDTSRIYLLGNPVVWWGSTIALIILLANILAGGIRRLDSSVAIMGGTWLMNMLPFIGISRVMFLYHYFTALIWAILVLAYLVDHSRRRKKIAIALGLTALAAFIFFAPLSYGLPLSDTSYNARVWLTSWR